jgi:hypothetical protein
MLTEVHIDNLKEMHISYQNGVKLHLSRNKKDVELGESHEEFVKICISKLFYAIDEDIFTAIQKKEAHRKVPTGRFDSAYSKVLHSITIIDDSVDASVKKPKGTKTKSAVNTNKLHLLKNKMAMHFLAQTYYLRDSLIDSDLYKTNKLADQINGETGGVSGKPSAFLLPMLNIHDFFSFCMCGFGSLLK